MQTEVLIVGGGLSGLSLAAQLHARDQDFLLVEGRDRIGGRMLTDGSAGGYFDLGPAWFWPGQPRIAALTQALGLRVFEQYYRGTLTMEDERGQIHRGRGFASMQGSLRIHGGMGAVINALAQTLPQGRLHLDWPARSLQKTDAGIAVVSAKGQQILARRVVLAMPPRVASLLSYTPALPDSVISAMSSIATWMAGQAKAVAVYDTPFWRDAGLSGDAMSHFGPMVEIHDASPETGGPFGLFGFLGVPPQSRKDETALKQAVVAQFVRLFGPAAAQPKALCIKDWAFDPFTATEKDLQPLRSHPQYGLPKDLNSLWDGALLLSGTETAPQFGGYIEGALEAAEQTGIILKKEAYA